MYQNISKTDRILHCPENLGNNAKRLSDFEKKQGLSSWSISLRKEAYGFEADQTLVKSSSFVLGELARWRLLWIAVTRFNVIHFNNGKTIMPHRIPFSSVRTRTNLLTALIYTPYAWLLEGKDLSLLKLFGKRIYFTFQGSDARLSTHYTRLHTKEVLQDLNPDYLSTVSDSFKKKRIARSQHYAQQTFCLNPDLLINFSKNANFIPYYNTNLSQTTPHDVFENNAVHIVHAPSKRDIKGTKYIISAMDKLVKENPLIQFTLVENMTNREAQDIYDTADLFIDQLIVGWYGGVSVELLARGVPTFCYITKENLTALTTQMREALPIVNTAINSLENDLTTFLEQDKQAKKALAEKSRKYVEEFHSCPIKHMQA